MIKSYSFGRLEVEGREFRKDLLILSDGSIHHPWRRKSGHRLRLDDLVSILETPPKILIVGTGYYGMMKPDEGLKSMLAKKGITVKILKTKKAAAEFNSLLAKGESVSACFHLTC